MSLKRKAESVGVAELELVLDGDGKGEDEYTGCEVPPGVAEEGAGVTVCVRVLRLPEALDCVHPVINIATRLQAKIQPASLLIS